MASLRLDPVLSPVIISAIISVIGFVLSVGSAMFISGTRWGEMKGKVNTIEDRTRNFETVQLDMAVLKHDVAEIKGMFTMKIKSE
jgi:hypothetical protein